MEVPRSESIKNFIETHRETLEHARALFYSNDYETFVTLKPVLQELRDQYATENSVAEDEMGASFPLQIFDSIIGRSYVTEQEASFVALPEERGLYLPHESLGGGDYWATEPQGNDLGEVTLLDMASHGAETLYPKALLTRMIQLYKKEPHGEGQPHLFAAIDAFLDDLPIPFQQMDHMEGRIIERDNKKYLTVELSGNVHLFIRDHSTGAVQYADTFQTQSEVVSPIIVDRYPQLGAGLAKTLPRNIQPIPLPEHATVYFATDGLFSLKSHDTKFIDAFTYFCETHRTLSADAFREELFRLIRDIKTYDAGDDDVTVLLLETR